MKDKDKKILTILLVAVVVGAAGFFGGMQYQKSQVTTLGSNAQFGQSGQTRQGSQMGQPNGTRRGGKFGGATTGEIISVDGDTITVKLQDGSSKIVNISDKTTINKASAGAKTDLKTGERVTAVGSTNSDGSITAQMVSLGTGMIFRGGPAGQGGPGNQQGGKPQTGTNQ